MVNKKIIIIGILLLIIAGIVLVMLTSVKYEKIEITPNGTTMDVPEEKTKYQGDFNKVKLWNWDKGLVISYNSNEENSLVNIGEMGFNTLTGIINKGTSQNIDGFTCYVINADDLLEIQLFDFIKLNYKGKFYCIQLSNETTHDNIIICCNDKDIALHMAKSVEYKNVYPNKPKINDTQSKIKNITDDLMNKTVLSNSGKIDDVKSNIENVADNLESKARYYGDKIPNFKNTHNILLFGY